MEADDGVGEVRTQPHTGARPTGRLANRPMQKEARAEMEARSGDEIPLDILLAEGVLLVDGADGVISPPLQMASAARIRRRCSR